MPPYIHLLLMKILFINPPNCGRSIPEERYGITSIKQIFRGEPLALEVLAGNLGDHETRILDLKVDSDGLQAALKACKPELVALTAMTCEAQTVVNLAREIKQSLPTTIVVGGVHASADPEFFNREMIDWIVIGLGKQSENTSRFVNFWASFEIIGPPGYPSPKILATLSKHSPAASSLVSPINLYFPISFIRISWVCPPETTKHIAGKARTKFFKNSRS